MVAERVREALRTSPIGDSLTVSAGIACYPTHALDAAELVARAGRALELARDAGHERDHVAIADSAGLTPSRQSAKSSAISLAYFAAIPRRLSFIVGVSSSESGSHSVGSTVNFLIASACENRSLATADLALDLRQHHRIDSPARPASSPWPPCARRPRRNDVGIEHEQRGEVRLDRRPTTQACPISGCALSAASRLAGETFLPPAVMMSSFLRSTIRR